MRSKIGFHRRSIRGRKATRPVGKEHSRGKPANTELKKHHSMLEGIIDSAGEPIFSVDRQYRYTCFNNAHASVMKTIYGKDIEIGGSLLDYMTVTEDREKAKRNLDRVLAGERVVEGAYSGEEARSRLYFEVSHSPIRAKGGAIVGVAVFVEDITERNRVEEKLRLSEERYRSLVDRMLDGIYRSTHEGRFLDVNPAFVKMFQYSSKQEMLDVDIKKELYFSPEERGSDFLDTGQEEVEVFRMRRKDGSAIWVEDHGRYVQGEKGNVMYHEGILRDITERRRMEAELEKHTKHIEELVEERTKELRASEEKYRSLVQNIPEAILTCDREGNAIFVSPTIERVYGYTAKEILEGGESLWAPRIHPDDMGRVDRAYEALFVRNEPFDVQYRYQKKDGTWVWLHDRATSTYMKDGVRYADGIISDITEHRRIEEDLRASMERLDFLLTANPAVIFSGKPHGDLKDFDRTYFSRNIIAMLGYEPLDFINDPKFWERHVYPGDRQRVLDSLPHLFREGHISNDYRFLHKDGTYRWIRGEVRAVPDATGKPTQVVGYWTDVTAQKRLEEALLKSEKLAGIGEAAAMVGHDLRNPLQATTGALYIAKKLIESPNPEERKEAMQLLDTLDSQVRYMDKIVSDLQSYATPVVPAPTETDMHDLIENVISDARIPDNVATEVTIPEELSMAIVDPVLIRRVVTNLVLNAVQAMPNGGKLSVTLMKQDGSMRMTVRDSGVGIATENLEKIFSPFFTTKAKGQGLGLAACKQLIEAQDGAITVQSEVGKGSIFTVKIPVNYRTPTSSN